MKQRILVLALFGALAAISAYGSGYRIPEQSINSIALANAYVANTQDADTSYFNPANMSWFESGWRIDAELMYIHLPQIGYSGNYMSGAANGDSLAEDFILPVFYAVSPEVNNFRIGFSLTYPAGLSKRWDEAPQRITAEDFTLTTTEFNPTISYRFCDIFSAAVGVRAVYADGEVRSEYYPAPGVSIQRDLEGDTMDYGYNLAITAKPNSNITFAVTYRSKVKLHLEGNADIIDTTTATNYSGYAEVEVPVPAVLTVGTSYRFENTTLELVYDKTYWNTYDKLDFNYSESLASFDAAVPKHWSNTNAFRIGLTHKCNDNLTAMVGFAIEGNPIPDSTLGYELPDSDGTAYSFGFKYKLKDRLNVGAAYLFEDKDKRTVDQGASGIQGTFSDGGAHLFNIGVNYRF